MTTNNAGDQSTKKTNVTRGIVQRFTQVIVQMVIIAVTLFAASGKPDWAWAWVYLGAGLATLIFNAIVLLSIDPEMVAERGKVMREGTKNWDKWISGLTIFPTLGVLIVAGLDERWEWSPAYSTTLHIAGLVVLVLAQLLFTWAMASNKFFELSVRIQEERQQVVATGGAYRLVRHPGYTGFIIMWLILPVVLGSLWGLIPGGIIGILLIVRTALEDKTLQEELPGYKEYAQKTRYRLIPGIW